MREAFSHYLIGSIRLREGANVNPGLALELTEHILGRVLTSVAWNQAEDNKRVAVLLGNQATLSGTVGEFKALAKKTKAEREKLLKTALDDMEASAPVRRSNSRSHSGSISARSSACTNGSSLPRSPWRRATDNNSNWNL